MPTGDLNNNFEKLRRLLTKVKYDKHFNSERICAGDTTELLPVLNFALLGCSRVVAKHISDSGYKLYARNDVRFVEGVFKVCREVLRYYPKLSPQQFLTHGFAERKLMLVCDIIKLCMALHNKLCKRIKAQTKESVGDITERLAGGHKKTAPEPEVIITRAKPRAKEATSVSGIAPQPRTQLPVPEPEPRGRHTAHTPEIGMTPLNSPTKEFVQPGVKNSHRLQRYAKLDKDLVYTKLEAVNADSKQQLPNDKVLQNIVHAQLNQPENKIRAAKTRSNTMASPESFLSETDSDEDYSNVINNMSVLVESRGELLAVDKAPFAEGVSDSEALENPHNVTLATTGSYTNTTNRFGYLEGAEEGDDSGLSSPSVTKSRVRPAHTRHNTLVSDNRSASLLADIQQMEDIHEDVLVGLSPPVISPFPTSRTRSNTMIGKKQFLRTHQSMTRSSTAVPEEEQLTVALDNIEEVQDGDGIDISQLQPYQVDAGYDTEESGGATGGQPMSQQQDWGEQLNNKLADLVTKHDDTKTTPVPIQAAPVTTTTAATSTSTAASDTTNALLGQLLSRFDKFEVFVTKSLDTVNARMTLLEGQVRFMEVQQKVNATPASRSNRATAAVAAAAVCSNRYCTCGANCQCGDSCKCGVPAKTSSGTICTNQYCTCGSNCQCGATCVCGVPADAKEASGCNNQDCTCGDNCQCGESCKCGVPATDAPTTGGCPNSYCTCGSNCQCGASCVCGVPATEAKQATGSCSNASCTCGDNCSCGASCKCGTTDNNNNNNNNVEKLAADDLMPDTQFFIESLRKRYQETESLLNHTRDSLEDYGLDYVAQKDDAEGSINASGNNDSAIVDSEQENIEISFQYGNQNNYF